MTLDQGNGFSLEGLASSQIAVTEITVCRREDDAKTAFSEQRANPRNIFPILSEVNLGMLDGMSVRTITVSQSAVAL